jgi:protein-tyrosine phosphatase
MIATETTDLPGAPRHVPLTGASNFRDLGGYHTAAGETAWGRIYRADALTLLSTEDIAELLKRGLTTVVDLRFEREVREHPNVFSGHASVQYHHNPVLMEDPASSGIAERLRTIDFRVHNVAMIKESSQTFAYLFHLLGQPEAYPLVFHCAGGRDRTGVAAALVLTAAGVSCDEVISDYLLSNGYLVGMMARMSDGLRRQGVDPEPIMANLHLREAYLLPMLDTIEAEFGGIDGYLRSIGVTQAELEVLREQFAVAA